LPPQSKLPPQATLSPQSKIASSEQNCLLRAMPPQSKIASPEQNCFPRAKLLPQSKIASPEQVFKKDLSNACKKKLPPQSKFSKKTCPMHVYNIKLDD